jgi:pyruvate kinase
MLSAETATGAYPLEAVQAMVRVCVEAEKECEIIPERRFMNEVFTRIDQSIAMAALFSAYHVKARAIGALTQSGSTALRMSRTNVGVPIYALSSLRETRRKVTLASGVHPIRFTSRSHDREEVLRAAEEELLHRGAVAEGDLIVLTIGEMVGKAGQTNTMKVVRVGDGRA